VSDPFDSLWGTRDAGPDDNGSAGVGVSPIKPTNTPLRWLFLAAAAAVVGAVGAFLIGSATALSILPWLVAGPIGFGLIGLFSHRDAVAQAGYYRGSSLKGALYPVVAILVLVGTAWASYQLATWVATR